jgi:tetratricopeptide (TPR) repeat protein
MNFPTNDGTHTVTLQASLAKLLSRIRARAAVADRFEDAWIEGLVGEVLRAAEHGELVEAVIEKHFHTTEEGLQSAAADARTAFLYCLQGVCFEAAGKPTEAATAYYEGGRRYSWQNEPAIAITLLTRANRLSPEHVGTYWHFADAWLMRSYGADSRRAKAYLAKSLTAWDRGAVLHFPDSSTSWAYVTRALLNEQLALSHSDRREELWWEAVTYLERAISLDESEPLRWSYLSRFHRYLENDASSVQAAGDALDLDPDNATALEERAAVMADTGNFDDAERAITKRLDQDPSNTWAKGVKAYVFALKKRYEPALKMIEEVVHEEPESIWNLDLQAFCHRMMGNRDCASELYSKIWEIYQASSDPTTDESIAARAAYCLGELDQAIAIFDRLSKDPLGADNAFRNLGLCYLAKGDLLRGEKYLQRGIDLAKRSQALADLLEIDLQECEATWPSWATSPNGEVLLLRVKARIEARLSELDKAPGGDQRAEEKAAQRELERVVTALNASGSDTWAWTGAQAGLARLHSQGERWPEAAAIYKALRRTGNRFPEARLGLEKAGEAFRGEGARLARDKKDFKEAVGKLDQALTWASEAGDSKLQADLHCGIGLVQLDVGDTSRSRASLFEALRLYREVSDPHAGEALAAAIRPLLRDVQQFWKVDSWLRGLGSEPGTDEGSRDDLAQARKSLMAYLDDVYQLAPSGNELPVVTPVVLEVGSALVPKVDPKSDDGKFINKDIVDMREGIERATGVTVPGVRVRENVSIPKNGYVIMLDEVPMARGEVQIDLGYCPASVENINALDISVDRLVEVQDPSTGRPGYWISPAHRRAIESKGLEWRSETAFILSHLQDVLRRNLANFLGLDEVETFLKTAASKKETSVDDTALPDVSSRLRFARVLRALVRETVPITAMREILETIQERGLTDIGEAVRGCRIKLRRQLPGNQPNAQRIEVPDEWEKFLTGEGEKSVFAASPYDAYKLMLAVRRWMEGKDRNAVLVTRSAAVRPFLRRLVEFEFDHAMVLSHEEALARDEPAAATTTAYGAN